MVRQQKYFKYYCNMREALKNVFGKEIILEDGIVFIYTVQPYEMKNMLGQIVAVLDEYAFTKKGTSETYKLYRTNEGNWYDANGQNSGVESSILLALKNAVDTLQAST